MCVCVCVLYLYTHVCMYVYQKLTYVFYNIIFINCLLYTKCHCNEVNL